MALILLSYRQEALQNIWQAFLGVSTYALATALILFAAARLLQALCLRQALLIFGERPSYLASLELCGIKGFYNLTFQGAGILAQLASGLQKTLFSIRSFIASALLQSLLMGISIGMSVAVLAFALPEEATSRNIMMLFGFLIAGSGLILVLTIRRYSVHTSVLGPRLSAVLTDIHEFLTSAKLTSLALAGGYQLIFAWLRLARFVWISVLLSPDINVIEVSAIGFAGDLASLLPLTPGGIGLREFVIGTGGLAIGHMDILVAAAVVDRGVTIFGNIVHGLIVISGNFVARAGR